MKIIDLLEQLKSVDKNTEIKIGHEIALCGGRTVKCHEEVKVCSIEGVIILIPTGKEVSYDEIEYD